MAPRRTLSATKVTRRRKGRPRCEVRPENPRRPDQNAVSIDDVKTCAAECDNYWFKPATMRFFKSRVSATAYADGAGGAYFVSSEKGPFDTREYSVRRWNPDECDVDTVKEFGQYQTLRQARRAAIRLADAALRRKAATRRTKRRR